MRPLVRRVLVTWCCTLPLARGAAQTSPRLDGRPWVRLGVVGVPLASPTLQSARQGWEAGGVTFGAAAEGPAGLTWGIEGSLLQWRAQPNSPTCTAPTGCPYRVLTVGLPVGPVLRAGPLAWRPALGPILWHGESPAGGIRLGVAPQVSAWWPRTGTWQLFTSATSPLIGAPAGPRTSRHLQVTVGLQWRGRGPEATPAAAPAQAPTPAAAPRDSTAVMPVPQPQDSAPRLPRRTPEGDAIVGVIAPPAIHFGFDQATLTATGHQEVRRALAALGPLPPTGKLLVIGHTDHRGPASYNLRLGMARAMAVVAALKAAGVPGDRLYALSAGELQPPPVAPTDTPAARRVEIRRGSPR